MTFESKTKIVEEEQPEIIVTPGRQGEENEPHVTMPTEAAILPVRNMVIYPGTVIPLQIGREKSRRLLSTVLPDQKVIVTVCQKHAETEHPAPTDLYEVGTGVIVLKLLKLEDDNQSVIVHGRARVHIEEYIQTEPYLKARIRVLDDTFEESTETEALVLTARNTARRVIQLSPNIPEEALVVLNNIDQPGMLADFLASNLQLDVPLK